MKTTDKDIYTNRLKGEPSKATLEIIDTIKQKSVAKMLEMLNVGKFEKISMSCFIEVHRVCMRANEGHDEGYRRIHEYACDTMIAYLKNKCALLKYETGESLVDTFIKETDLFLVFTNWLSKLFNHIDNSVTSQAKVKTICALSVISFRKVFIEPIKGKLFKTVNTMILDDRLCKVVDRTKIEFILNIFDIIDIEDPIAQKVDDKFTFIGRQSSHTKLNNNEEVDSMSRSTRITYKEWLLSQIEDLIKFLNEKVSKEISSYSCPEYVTSMNKFLEEEDQRKKLYFVLSEYHYRYNEQLHKIIIQQPGPVISKKDTGIKTMLTNDKQQELADIYKLFIRFPEAIKNISNDLSPFIKEKGVQLYNNKELARDPTKFVPKLIESKIYMDGLVSKCFDNNIKLQDCKNKAFSSFMNKEHYSKQLALFCDYQMKVGIKGNNENQIEAKLDDIINIFKCLNNKIIFQHEYSKKLSERLIAGKTQSKIAEKNLITKLKAEQGVTYVNKMTSMLEDLETSITEVDNFRKKKHAGRPEDVQMSVQVLQHGAWELEQYKFLKLSLSTKLGGCVKAWEEYYKERHKTHKLKWVHGSGNLEVQTTFLKRTYFITMTVVQYHMLILLEKNGELPAAEIANYIGDKEFIIINELNGLLYHPSFNMKRLKTSGLISHNLSKEENEISPKTKVSINKDFAGPNLKLNSVPLLFKKSAEEIKSQENLDAQNMKAYQNIVLDATITRIMKGRIGKKTPHAELVTEVSKQVDLFVAQPPQIKERIENLIEKEIIKREDSDQSCYQYIS